jgi:hypothetical protein
VNPEAEGLTQETAALRKLANQAGERGNWQLQLHAWAQLVALAPRLWRLMRDQPLKPKVEEAIPALAEAYAALLDVASLQKLRALVDTVPELHALYSAQIASCQARVWEYRRLYEAIQTNPHVEESSLNAPRLIHDAVKLGIVERTKKGGGSRLTFRGIPTIESMTTEANQLASLPGEETTRGSWLSRLLAWLRYQR